MAAVNADTTISSHSTNAFGMPVCSWSRAGKWCSSARFVRPQPHASAEGSPSPRRAYTKVTFALVNQVQKLVSVKFAVAQTQTWTGS